MAKTNPPAVGIMLRQVSRRKIPIKTFLLVLSVSPSTLSYQSMRREISFLKCFYPVNGFLKSLKKPSCVRAIHLGVVKLERQLQRRPKKTLMILTPDEKRVIENAAVHADSPVDFSIHNGTSQELISLFLFFTIVFTAILSYRSSSLPTGSR